MSIRVDPQPVEWLKAHAMKRASDGTTILQSAFPVAPAFSAQILKDFNNRTNGSRDCGAKTLTSR
jgi:hypothetical protein